MHQYLYTLFTIELTCNQIFGRVMHSLTHALHITTQAVNVFYAAPVVTFVVVNLLTSILLYTVISVVCIISCLVWTWYMHVYISRHNYDFHTITLLLAQLLTCSNYYSQLHVSDPLCIITDSTMIYIILTRLTCHRWNKCTLATYSTNHWQINHTFNSR